MRPAALLAAAGAVAVLGLPGAAPGSVRLSDEELSEQRGGLMSPIGLEIGFGATVRTFVDGGLALETRLTWTEAGAVAEQVHGDVAAFAGPPVHIGRWSSGVADAPRGATNVLHDLSDGRVVSVVINTADNRTIRQETDINLFLPQFADLQRQMIAERLSTAIQTSLGTAVRDSAGR